MDNKEHIHRIYKSVTRQKLIKYYKLNKKVFGNFNNIL